jgi:mannose-6-phosphate isomerase
MVNMPGKPHILKQEHRPWGYYQVISDEPDLKVKKIVVYPGKRLSLQRHQRRSEHWYIIHGLAIVTLEANDISLEAGKSVDIPKGSFHRIMNAGTETLAFIEVQTGDYFGEDDIERVEDDYGRVL